MAKPPGNTLLLVLLVLRTKELSVTDALAIDARAYPVGHIGGREAVALQLHVPRKEFWNPRFLLKE